MHSHSICLLKYLKCISKVFPELYIQIKFQISVVLYGGSMYNMDSTLAEK